MCFSSTTAQQPISRPRRLGLAPAHAPTPAPASLTSRQCIRVCTSDVAAPLHPAQPRPSAMPMPFLPALAAFFGAPPPQPPSEEHTPTDWGAGHDASWRLPVTQPASSSRHGALPTSAPAPSTTASARGQDAAYPHLAPVWARIRTWCRRQFPEIADTLNLPATPDAIEEFERRLGRSLPAAVRESFALVNGQDNESLSDAAQARSRAGLVLGLPLLSIEESMAEWSYWRHVDSDPSSGANSNVKAYMASCPEGWVSPQYSNPGWIPLITDRMGNYIGVDLSPPSMDVDRRNRNSLADALSSTSFVDFGPTSQAIASSSAAPLGSLGTSRDGLTGHTSFSAVPSPSPGGSPMPRLSPAPSAHGHGEIGQVIVFGRDFDTKVVLHPGSGKGGWGHFLAFLAETLEAGKFFTLDEEPGESSDDEDYIGYESYFGGTTGSNAVGGGPASEHLGGYGFRLSKPYKGIGVLEALADRSSRYWEEEGYLRGLSQVESAWRQSQPINAEQEQNEDARHVSTQPLSDEVGDHQEHPLVDPSSDPCHLSTAAPLAAQAEPSQSSELDHPLSPWGEEDMNGGDLASRSSFSTDSGTVAPMTRRRAPPPEPAERIALPTIEDVQAVQEEVLQDALGEDYRDMKAAAERRKNRRGKLLHSVSFSWPHPPAPAEPDLEASAPEDQAGPSNKRSWSSYLPRNKSHTSPPATPIGLTSPPTTHPSPLGTNAGDTPGGIPHRELRPFPSQPHPQGVQ